MLASLFQSHPGDPSRSLVAYEAVLLFEPSTMLGTTVGVLCNLVFPEWLTMLLLLLVLAFTTVRMSQKGVQVMRKELISCIKRKPAPIEVTEKSVDKQIPTGDPHFNTLPHTDEETQGLLEKLGTIDSMGTPVIASKPFTIEESTSVNAIQDVYRLKHILRDERRTPIGSILLIVICWLIVLGLSLLRGGPGITSIINIQSCDMWYWIIFALCFPIIIFVIGSVAIANTCYHREKIRLHYQFKKGDIVWTVKSLLLYPFYCWVAGIMAALLGIGGGIIKGPLLLDLGIDPIVANTTSSFMVLFTSSITCMQYIILGRLSWDYGLWFVCIGFLSSLLGQLVIGCLVRRFRISFIIIFSMCIMMGLATLLMGASGTYNTVTAFQKQVSMFFR